MKNKSDHQRRFLWRFFLSVGICCKTIENFIWQGYEIFSVIFKDTIDGIMLSVTIRLATACYPN